MAEIGTPLSSTATKVLFCGSGELGKEVIIEMMRLGVEVIAVDRYANAPGMQVAHRSYVINMLDGKELRAVIEKEKPDYIVPEVEAIATDTLVELEKEGYNVIPTAKATKLTMNREGIRRLAAEELGLKTSPYRFADNYEDFKAAVKEIGIPCVVKPVMSSSGHGQSVIKTEADIENSWNISQTGGRTGAASRVIVEGFVPFDYEITLLTVRHVGGTSFLGTLGTGKGDCKESHGRSWRSRHLWCGTFCLQGRGLVQRSLSASARYGHGDAHFSGPLRICIARTRYSRSPDSEHCIPRPERIKGNRCRWQF